ncbi:MAG: nucleoside triphosphate pyrophosphohydrolase family protein [Ktedonobacterales bacterium]
MDWNTYRRLALRTAGSTSAPRDRLVMGALGLSGEAGEVTDHVKKIVFQGHEIDRAALMNELGDVMWYVSYLLDTLDLEMDDVLAANIAKLQARYPDGFDPQRSRSRETDATDEQS